MALVPLQVTTTGAAAADLFPAATFVNQPIAGSLADPIPITILCPINLYVGGNNTVNAANGFLLPANTPLNLQVLSNDHPWGFTTVASTVYVLGGRQ
jgi:hypothetical protein